MIRNLRWLLIMVITFCSCSAYAQSGTWVWINGSDTGNSRGNYGIKGVSSVNNNPPALYQAAQWTDKQGNFWIFGGVLSLQAVNSVYSDLWEYSPVSQTWTWINGPGVPNQPATFGVMGIPSVTNTPGARSFGCATWVDSTGDLWLFGGGEIDSDLSDLWRYHIATNEWTWIGGPANAFQPGVYGSLYQPSDSSWPQARSEANAAWTDANNNLWLFGGEVDSGQTSGCYSDMWRYNIAIAQWAWMGGGIQLEAPGNYGSPGVESPANRPPVRAAYTHWLDSNYLYISCGMDFQADYIYNDVWRFNLNTNYWTWVGGDEGNTISGQYSHYCSENFGDKPMGRLEQRSTQINGCSPVLFMWGGMWGSGFSVLNDLWSFDPVTRNWQWISGYDSINAFGNYGVKGVPAATNMPPGAGGSCFWNDMNGNLWLWGGRSDVNVDQVSDPVFLNAMWEYVPDPACFAGGVGGNNLNFQFSPAGICSGDSAFISFDYDSGILILPDTGVTWFDLLHAALHPDSTTVYTISGYSHCGGFRSQAVTVIVTNEAVTITADKTMMCPGDTTQICATTGFSAYNWNIGDTTTCIYTSLPGNYYVTATENGNCTAVSNQIAIATYSLFSVVLSVNGDTLHAYNGSSYQWYFDSTLITGATSDILIADQPGQYFVVETDTNGCVATSSQQYIGATGIADELLANSFTVYPNPSVGSYQLTVSNELLNGVAEVFDATGRVVFYSTIDHQPLTINISGLVSGVYELRITAKCGSFVTKLVKQ